jgi:predicted RNase H-like nuclease (RuvC/YqgF family)
MPPKPPKRRKKFGRDPRTNANKKRSTYDFDSAREIIGADSINHAQLMMRASQTGPKPPAPKSLLKKQYKAMLHQKEYELVDALEENYKLLEKNESLQRDTELNKKKVLHFKEENRKLAQALRDKKSKSRLISSSTKPNPSLLMPKK